MVFKKLRRVGAYLLNRAWPHATGCLDAGKQQKLPKAVLGWGVCVAAAGIGLSGCTSFRTTALMRFPDDSLAPQPTNRKLKGLPVKLKVPSHVHAVVYEQQVILADSNDDKTAKTQATAAITAKIETQKQLISGLQSGVQNAETTLLALQAGRAKYQQQLEATQDANERAVLNKLIKKVMELIIQAQTALADARVGELKRPAERNKLKVLEEQLAVAQRDASIKYKLVSFSPPQYVVETELQYTDKVFMVDFKRPAAGILDLTEASMDDEQYFSKVQAEVEEQTLSDIGAALDTLTDPLVSTFGQNRSNVAVATSAKTPDGEENETVDFQRSVIATQRFDVNEPGWEQRLQAFINFHLGGGVEPTELPVPAAPGMPSKPAAVSPEVIQHQTKAPVEPPQADLLLHMERPGSELPLGNP